MKDALDDYPIGQLLPGTKYVTVRKLGQGGMGVVYEVVKEPGIRGAAKIMTAKLARRPEAVKRFYDEAARVAKLRHPNIVQIIDYDKLAFGTPFLVMELLEGKTLGQLLHDLRGRGLRPEHAFAIMTQLLAGLHHAHSVRGEGGKRAPIIHRDIKPENIFLHLPRIDGVEPSVKILDLGISADDSASEKHFVGSYPWAAPEQFKLEPATPQTDLYAAGLVLFKMLTGKNPFEGLDTHEQFMLAHVAQEAPPLPEWVPAEVRELVASALAKDPEQRPRSAYEFSAKLWSLQFVRRAAEPAVDASTTAPTLGTLAGLADGRASHGPTMDESAPAARGATLPMLPESSPELEAKPAARSPDANGTMPIEELSQHPPPASVREKLDERRALANAITRTQDGAKPEPEPSRAGESQGAQQSSTSGVAQSVLARSKKRRAPLVAAIVAAAIALIAVAAVKGRRAATEGAASEAKSAPVSAPVAAPASAPAVASAAPMEDAPVPAASAASADAAVAESAHDAGGRVVTHGAPARKPRGAKPRKDDVVDWLERDEPPPSKPSAAPSERLELEK